MSYEDEQIEEVFELEPDVEDNASRPMFDDKARSKLALQMLKQVQQSIAHVIQLLEDGDAAAATRGMVNFVMQKKQFEQTFERETGSRVHEGVFDGVFMIGAEGVRHQIPENYASKSRLVEGDMLKLTIRSDGSHVYKQIAPVERRRITGRIGTDPVTNSLVVISGDDLYKVLTASVSYFKVAPGDEVVILVPGSGKSAWAALESVVRK